MHSHERLQAGSAVDSRPGVQYSSVSKPLGDIRADLPRSAGPIAQRAGKRLPVTVRPTVRLLAIDMFDLCHGFLKGLRLRLIL